MPFLVPLLKESPPFKESYVLPIALFLSNIPKPWIFASSRFSNPIRAVDACGLRDATGSTRTAGYRNASFRDEGTYVHLYRRGAPKA